MSEMFLKECSKFAFFYNRTKVSIVAQILSSTSQFYYRERYCIPTSYLFPSVPFHWRGLTIQFPPDTPRYLQHLYGKSWKTPITWQDTDMYNHAYIYQYSPLVHERLLNLILSIANYYARRFFAIPYLFLP